MFIKYLLYMPGIALFNLVPHTPFEIGILNIPILHVRKGRGSGRLSNLPKDRQPYDRTRIRSQATELQSSYF